MFCCYYYAMAFSAKATENANTRMYTWETREKKIPEKKKKRTKAIQNTLQTASRRNEQFKTEHVTVIVCYIYFLDDIRFGCFLFRYFAFSPTAISFSERENSFKTLMLFSLVRSFSLSILLCFGEWQRWHLKTRTMYVAMYVVCVCVGWW